MDGDLDTELNQETIAVPPLECCSILKSDTKLDSNLKACNEDLEEQKCKEQSIQPPTKGQQDTHQPSSRLNSIHPSFTNEEQVSPTHRSILVQTSKHLFWADKRVQASEHSLLQWNTSRQPGKHGTGKTTNHLRLESVPKDTPCSEKQLQCPSTQPELSDTGSPQPPSTHSPSNLPPAIGLEDLINLASSLAIASSSNRDLPNLGNIIKPPPQKAEEPSTVPVVESASPPPAKEEAEQEKLCELLGKPPEKPLEAGEPQKACKQEDKNFLHPYFDFSKPGLQKTALEGKVKFFSTSARPSPPKGDKINSVPGTKKQNPLLLKIHFKLLPQPAPRKMTKQSQ
ncbi:PREDICTED: spermatogenesis-associated protein 32 [Miniopterus natalensis]|uniref:spermatogenesis-associated protein 32 n=1 Tax=Miniopterus natalensis TaxID=291302 RepID=UPI0007A6D5A5|nr:PREDICTED: spermatogenesis-associated protein 32 [Miniopterus natalensis]